MLGLLGLARYARHLLVTIRSKVLRRIYPHGKYVTCNKCQIYVNFHDNNYLWYYGKNEFLLQEHAAFNELLKEKKPNVVLDIGAHWGVFPAQLASDESNFCIKQVVCIEPDPRSIPILEKTIKLINAFKVDIVPFAISDRLGRINIYTGGGSCAQTYRTDTSEKIGEVNTAPINEILRNLQIKGENVTHIKLDIDGFEPAFFFGAKDFLLANRPLLLIEFWAKGMKAAGFNLVDYWDMLQSMYNISEIVYPDNHYLPLSKEHLGYLEQKTDSGIVNLILTPRD